MKTKTKKEYWITPPELYKELDQEFHFDFDPCPYPFNGIDGTEIEWGQSNYVNPPYVTKDSPFGGKTAFIRKAIEEKAKGNTTVLLISVPSLINLLLEAGAELRPFGRVRFLDVDEKDPMKSPSPTMIAILKPNNGDNHEI